VTPVATATVAYLSSLDELPTLTAWLDTHTGRVAVDTETDSVRDLWTQGFRCQQVAIAASDGSGVVLDGRNRQLVRAALMAAFGPESKRRCWMHNATYDTSVIRRVYDIKLSRAKCTLVASRALWPSEGKASHSLKALRPATAVALEDLRVYWVGVTGRETGLGKGWLAEAVTTLDPGDPVLLAYVATDAVETARLADAIYSEAKEIGQLTAVRRDVAVDQVWRWTGFDGLHLDLDRLAARHAEVVGQVDAMTAALGFKPNTGNKERAAYVEGLGVQLTTTATGAASLAKESRAVASVPAEHAEEWAELDETMGAAGDFAKIGELEAASVGGVVHPKINANFAKTGRQSSSGPALQNLSAAMRGVFQAGPGKVLVSADLAHVEPTILAILSGDPVLTKFCRRGEDVYTETAAIPWGDDARETVADGSRTPAATVLRNKAKVIFIALSYGMGQKLLATQLGVTEAEARRVKDRVLGAYGGVKRWRATTQRNAERGIAPTTITGRVLPCPKRDEAFKAVNWACQGSAADLFKDMTLSIHAELTTQPGLDGARLWLPIHDEIVVECSPEQAEAVKEMLGMCMSMTVSGVEIFCEPIILGQHWRKV
jgi:hypothetical protein